MTPPFIVSCYVSSFSEVTKELLILTFHYTWLQLVLKLRWSIKPIFHCNAKPFALGPHIGLDPQLHNFALGIPTCWYLKMLKVALPPRQNIKFALPPRQNPNMSQRNIGCVGSPMQNFLVGHVHFMLFGVILFMLVTQREPSLQWNMGLSMENNTCKYFCNRFWSAWDFL